MRTEKRKINDGLGHQLQLKLESGILTISSETPKKQSLIFNKIESEILHAFIAVCLKMPREEGRREDLSPGKCLELIDRNNPRIILKDQEFSMELHPASWEPIMYEIALLLPRMGQDYAEI